MKSKSNTERVYFSLLQEYPKAVVSSQVVEYLELFSEKDIHFNMIFLIRLGAYLKGFKELNSNKTEIESRLNNKVSFFAVGRSYLNISIYLGLIILFFKFLRHRNAEQIVIHSRGTFTARLATMLKSVFKNLSVVYDVRGDYIAETIYHAKIQKSSISKIEKMNKLDMKIQRKIMGKVDHIFCVSDVLKKRIVERYGAKIEMINVIPCLADHNKFYFNCEMRKKVREELKIDNKFVFIYPGGIGYWHYTYKIFEIVKNLMLERNDIFFIVLTSQADEASGYAEKHLPANSYFIHSAEREEVPKYLMAADMGMLIREHDPLNEVAAPTKFAEYLMAGLPVLISEYIGDYSGFVEKKNVGLVFKDSTPEHVYTETLINFINNRSRINREQIAQIGFNNFAKINFTPRMSEIYSTI